MNLEILSNTVLEGRVNKTNDFEMKLLYPIDALNKPVFLEVLEVSYQATTKNIGVDDCWFILQIFYKMMLPIDPNFEKEEPNHGLIIHDMQIEDPFSASHQLQNNFINCPPFGLYDIFNYLIYHSTEYDKQGLAACKSFDDYRLFQDGYVESLLTEPLPNEGLHLFVSKVGPAVKEKTDVGKQFYDLWFIVEGKGVNRGSVVKVRCVCKGGHDGGCKHIAAAMYSLKDLLNTLGEDSTTSGLCQWMKKPTTDSRPCEVKDLQIKKSVFPLRKKRKSKHVYCEHIDNDVI